MAMNQQIKTKWVEALRSGKYQQTTSILESIRKDGTKRHCCLGVLCRVMEIEPTHTDDFAFFDGFASNLSDRIRNLAGLTVHDANELMALNDDLSYKFPEIADYIEANL